MSVVRGHRPALDGVRAIAIGGVLAQHLPLQHVHSGGLGVDVFFVLSGYLITGLLIGEHRDTGRLSLRSFYLRRVLRLYPALIALVTIGSLVIAAEFDYPTHTIVWGSVIAATYTTDLVSYTHNYDWVIHSPTWSLAIEEQFYLVWPLTLAFMLRRRLNAKLITSIALIALLTLALITARPLLVDGLPTADYTQLQAHAFGLLAGCLLAQLPVPRAVGRLAAPCMIGIVAVMVLFPETHGATYLRFGVPLTVLLTFGLIAGLEHDSIASRVLSLTPLRRLGVISYGVYLYNLLLFRVIGVHVHVNAHALYVIKLVAVIVLAEISYRFYESPIRALGRRRRIPPSAPQTDAEQGLELV